LFSADVVYASQAAPIKALSQLQISRDIVTLLLH